MERVLTARRGAEMPRPEINDFKPFISIVINCYNGEKFLKEALESVICQTYDKWEVIFWDNQSTDGSRSIFESYKDVRFRYFIAPNHTPLGEARNAACRMAMGEWFAFLDCDDVWVDRKLELQIEIIAKSSPRIGLIYSPFSIISENKDDNRIKKMRRDFSLLSAKPHEESYIFNALLERNYIVFSSILIRGRIFMEIGGIDTTLVQNEDYELLLKASQACTAACINIAAVKYRIHLSNNTHANYDAGYMENFAILEKLPQTKPVREALTRNYLRFAVFSVLRRDLVKSLLIIYRHFSIREIVRIIMQWFLRRFVSWIPVNSYLDR